MEAVLHLQLQDLQLHMLEVAEAVAELIQVMEMLVADPEAAGQQQIIMVMMEQMVSEAEAAEQEGNLLVQTQFLVETAEMELQSCQYLQEIIQV